MNSIEVEQLNKHFQTFALQNISFSVEAGTVVGVIGRNGAGKTTLLKSLLNIYEDVTGSATVLGQNAFTEDVIIKAQLGVVFDEFHLPHSLRATDLNRLYKQLFPAWDEAYFFDLLSELNLPHTKKVSTFSRGMRMLLQLALALSHHPKMLLLDEPTSGLDPVMRQHVLQLLSQFMEQEGRTIFFSSHITSDLDMLADTILCLHNGAVLFHENKDVLLYEYVIVSSAQHVPHAISERTSVFGTDYLVHKQHVQDAVNTKAVTLDDLLLFFTEQPV